MSERERLSLKGIRETVRDQKELIFFASTLQHQGERLFNIAGEVDALHTGEVSGDPHVVVESANFVSNDHLYSAIKVSPYDIWHINECYLNGSYKDNEEMTIFPIMSYSVHPRRRVVNDNVSCWKVLPSGDVWYSTQFTLHTDEQGIFRSRETRIKKRALKKELLTQVRALDKQTIVSYDIIPDIFRRRAMK